MKWWQIIVVVVVIDIAGMTPMYFALGKLWIMHWQLKADTAIKFRSLAGYPSHSRKEEL